MLDFEELRELAADVRIFIDLADDKAAALRDVIAAYDVVLAIYPPEGRSGPLRYQGQRILDKIAKSQTDAFYTHTAIAVPGFDHARKLKLLTEPQVVDQATIADGAPPGHCNRTDNLFCIKNPSRD